MTQTNPQYRTLCRDIDAIARDLKLLRQIRSSLSAPLATFGPSTHGRKALTEEGAETHLDAAIASYQAAVDHLSMRADQLEAA